MEELLLQGKIRSSVASPAGRGHSCKARNHALQNSFARSPRGPGRNLRMKSGCLVFFYLRSKKGEANGNAPTVGSRLLHQSIICVVNIKCSGSWGEGLACRPKQPATVLRRPLPTPYPRYLIHLFHLGLPIEHPESKESSSRWRAIPSPFYVICTFKLTPSQTGPRRHHPHPSNITSSSVTGGKKIWEREGLG